LVRFSILAAALAAVLASPALAQAPSAPASATAPAQSVEALLDAAIASPSRSEADKARDKFRNPKETLLFFGLKPDMQVLEVSPGGGWFTEILAPVLRERGQLYVGVNPNGNPRTGFNNFLKELMEKPTVFDRTRIAVYQPTIGNPLVKPNSLDMVLVFRHLHGLVGFKSDQAALKLMFEALKPGGVLGVEAHRWPANKPKQTAEELAKMDNKQNGYLTEAEVIALVEKAGFKLDGRSEINANPRDTHVHPHGVWSLPPTLNKVAEADRPAMLAIGESDRMTLRFVKPAAPAKKKR
jgi:predicted methyltransferase